VSHLSDGAVQAWWAVLSKLHDQVVAGGAESNLLRRGVLGCAQGTVRLAVFAPLGERPRNVKEVRRSPLAQPDPGRVDMASVLDGPPASPSLTATLTRCIRRL
jgi:hypothetical protein